jgi:hypothetical protein
MTTILVKNLPPYQIGLDTKRCFACGWLLPRLDCPHAECKCKATTKDKEDKR